MQDARFEIDPNGGFVVLGDETYVKSDNEFNLMIMKNPVSGAEVLIEESEITVDDSAKKIQAILERACDRLGIVFNSDENVEFDVCDKLKELRGYNSIIYPFTYEHKDNSSGKACIYTATELPDSFTSRYMTLKKFLEIDNVPLSMRIVVAINLAEIFAAVSKLFDSMIYSLDSTDFFINRDNGKTVFFLSRSLESDRQKVRNCDYSATVDIGGTENKDALGKKDLLRIIQYVTFRILCSGNPFDGKAALVEYPYISEPTVRNINTGKFGYVFDTKSKNYSQYSNSSMLMRYKALPKFIVSEFEKAFTFSDNTDVDDVCDWLFVMRKLRDCLVFVNNKFVLCDPETENNVLFIETCDYKIPVWPKKAVYWYHAGMSYNEVQNGIVAGVNADGSIENCTDKTWAVQYDGNVFFVEKGKTVKPVDGLVISIDSTVSMHIVDGRAKPKVMDDIDIPTVNLDDMDTDKNADNDNDSDSAAVDTAITDDNAVSEATD